MTNIEAAKYLEIDHPKITDLLRGKLSEFSMEFATS